MRRLAPILIVLLLAGCATPKKPPMPPAPPKRPPLLKYKLDAMAYPVPPPQPWPRTIRIEWPDGYCPWGFEVQWSTNLTTWQRVGETTNLWLDVTADQPGMFYRVKTVEK